MFETIEVLSTKFPYTAQDQKKEAEWGKEGGPFSNLKGVLGHSTEAIVGRPRGDGAHAQLADLVGFTQLRDAVQLHRAHHSCRWEGGCGGW